MANIEIHKKFYEPKDIVVHANKACGWFAAIAAFSLINSLLIFFKSGVSFVIGLGVTMVVDGFIAVGHQHVTGAAATALTVIGFLINLILIGVFVLIWFLSKRGSKAAYITGMILYFLDALLFLLFKDWVGVAFHAFFLYALIGGFGFIKARANAENLLATSSPATGDLKLQAQSRGQQGSDSLSSEDLQKRNVFVA
jgi:hypothetical protein